MGSKNLQNARLFVQRSLAQEVLVAHSWAARWTLAGVSRLYTSGCTLTDLLKKWWWCLKMSNICSVLLTVIRRSLSCLNVPLTTGAETILLLWPEPGCLCLSTGMQHALTSWASRRRRSWGLLKWRWRGEAALSQALTHLPAYSWQLKAREPACWDFFITICCHILLGHREDHNGAVLQQEPGKKRKEEALWWAVQAAPWWQRGLAVGNVVPCPASSSLALRLRAKQGFCLGLVPTWWFGLQNWKDFNSAII